jgi:hypothetical protein
MPSQKFIRPVLVTPASPRVEEEEAKIQVKAVSGCLWLDTQKNVTISWIRTIPSRWMDGVKYI